MQTRNRLIIISLILIGLMFSACAPKTITLNSQLKNNFENKTITFTNREGPLEPNVMTHTRAIDLSGMVGLLGSLTIALFDNDKNYKVNKVPSLYINNKLIQELTTKYNMKHIKNNTMTHTTSVDELIRQYPNSDYILDNTTTYWMIIYYPTHWTTYTVNLFNVMKLIDTKNAKIVAQKICQYQPKYKDNMPSYDEMFANNGALIKKETQKALDYCIEDFKSLLFN